MKRKIDRALGENMVVTSIYVNGAVLSELKRKLGAVGKSFNQEVDDWIKARLFELDGTAPGGVGTVEEAQARYESLKQQHMKLVAETGRAKNWLLEQKLFDNGVKLFGEVVGYNVSATAYEDSKCQNIIVNYLETASDPEFKDAMARFLVKAIKKDQGQLGHVFATYLETVRVKKQVERQLFASRVNPAECSDAEKLRAEEEAALAVKDPDAVKLPSETGEASETHTDNHDHDSEEDSDDDSDISEDEEEEESGFEIDFNVPHGSISPGKPTVDSEEEDAEDEGGE